MVAAESQNTIRFTDVAMSVDLHYYLRRWEGAYKLSWESADTAAVRFTNPQDQQGEEAGDVENDTPLKNGLDKSPHPP